MFLVKEVKKSFISFLNTRDAKTPPPPFNERLVEYSFVLKSASKLYPKKVLDVGTGTTALPAMLKACGCDVKAIDNIIDYWPAGMINKHFHVENDDITNTKLKERFDLVSCISVLEHVDMFDMAVKNMSNLLNIGGHLVLTCPYNESKFCDNVYELEGSNAKGKIIPYKTRAFSRENVNFWATQNGLELVDQEYWQFFSGAYWTQGDRIFPPIKSSSDQVHQITCLSFKKIV